MNCASSETPLSQDNGLRAEQDENPGLRRKKSGSPGLITWNQKMNVKLSDKDGSSAAGLKGTLISVRRRSGGTQ
jgi:hypothetical protein